MATSIVNSLNVLQAFLCEKNKPIKTTISLLSNILLPQLHLCWYWWICHHANKQIYWEHLYSFLTFKFSYLLRTPIKVLPGVAMKTGEIVHGVTQNYLPAARNSTHKLNMSVVKKGLKRQNAIVLILIQSRCRSRFAFPER